MATSPDTFSSIPAQADPNALLEAGNEHVWIHASSWRALAASQEGKRIMVEGRGCILKDIDGKEYIDGLAGLWLVNVGHGREEIGEAMAAQGGAPAHARLNQKTTLPAVQIATPLFQNTPCGLSPPVFFHG